jgi:hypothetical protein
MSKGNQKQSIQTMEPTSKVLQINFMKPTRCFNPHHIWQGYRTYWPMKDETGNSSHHMDLTSENYGKQQ